MLHQPSESSDQQPQGEDIKRRVTECIIDPLSKLKFIFGWGLGRLLQEVGGPIHYRSKKFGQ